MLALLLTAAFALPTPETRAETRFRHGWLAADGILAEIRHRMREDPPLSRHRELVVEAIAAAPWWLDRLSPSNVDRVGQSLEGSVADRMEEIASPAAVDRFDLARISLLADRPDRAEEILLGLVADGVRIDRGPWHPSSPRLLLARIARGRGDLDEARRWLEEAAEERPGDPWVLAERIALDDDPESRRRLAAWWSPLDEDLLLGRALLDQGRSRQAVPILARVVEDFPELRRARIDLAAALGQSGQVEAGVEAYLEATAERLDPVRRAPEIRDLFRRWAELHPDDGEIRLLALRILAHLGDFDDAARRLEALEGEGLLPPDRLEPAAAFVRRLQEGSRR